jgi:hypothetical protein
MCLLRLMLFAANFADGCESWRGGWLYNPFRRQVKSSPNTHQIPHGWNPSPRDDERSAPLPVYRFNPAHSDLQTNTDRSNYSITSLSSRTLFFSQQLFRPCIVRPDLPDLTSFHGNSLTRFNKFPWKRQALCLGDRVKSSHTS